MMRMFVRNNVVLFVLVVTTTLDASRIFYLPLPKIHSSQHKQQQQPESQKQVNQEASKKQISDEFIPSSAIEREEFEKRGDNFDWEELVDKEAATKRRITVNELLPESLQKLAERYSSNEHKINDNRAIEASLDKISQADHEDFREESWSPDNVDARAERLQSSAVSHSIERQNRRNNTLFVVIVGTCSVVGVLGLVAAAIFWYKVQQRTKAAADTEYPAYGVTAPNTSSGKISPSSSMSDRKLAQSAQMYHYQQQRQQMMAQEKEHLDSKPNHSDDSDDEAPGGGDYTVYECPGLAPTGEMEVRNPLFAEPDSSLISPTRSSYPSPNSQYPQLSTASPPKERSLP